MAFISFKTIIFVKKHYFFFTLVQGQNTDHKKVIFKVFIFWRYSKRGTYFNDIKMLKIISLALLTQGKHIFKNVEALLSVLGPCSKDKNALIFLSS